MGLPYPVSYSSSSSQRGQLSVLGENSLGVSHLPLSSLPAKPGPEPGHPSLRRVRVPTALDSDSRMGIPGNSLEIQMLRSQPRPAGAELHFNKIPAKLYYRHAGMKTGHRGGEEPRRGSWAPSQESPLQPSSHSQLSSRVGVPAPRHGAHAPSSPLHPHHITCSFMHLSFCFCVPPFPPWRGHSFPYSIPSAHHAERLHSYC